MGRKITNENRFDLYCQTHNLEYLLDAWDDSNIKTPDMYSYGSKQIVYWKCSSCGTPYPAQIALRTNKSGDSARYCKDCRRKKTWETRKKNTVWEDWTKDHFEIFAEWDYEENASHNITPRDISKGSHKKAWWKCPLGHPSYPSNLPNRIDGKGCPVCGGRVLYKGFNDLASQFPYVARQWDYEKNYPKAPDEVFKRERNPYWWICPICGESYKASVSNRTKGTNHKPCSQKGTSFPEQAIYYYVKQIFEDAVNRDTSFGYELDIYIPSKKIAIEFDGSLYHNSTQALEKDNKKDTLCKEDGVTLYRFREPILPDTASAIRITCDYDKDNFTSLNETLQSFLSDIAPQNIINVDIKRDYYTILDYSLLQLEKRSITVTHPNIAKEWHPTKNLPLTPNKVSAGMGIYIWWVCSKCKYEYPAKMYSRKRGSGCPECAKKDIAIKHSRTSAKKNNFAKQYPELVKEILDLNSLSRSLDEYSAGNDDEKIQWKCSQCGHIWPATIAKRVDGTGCPVCGQRRTNAAAKRSVINLDTGVVYDSLTQAAESCGGDKRGISNCCSDKVKSAYGFRWAYVDESTKRIRHDDCFVYNVDTGELFKTIQEAADHYGCDRSSISKALRGKAKKSQGCRWEWIQKDKADTL